MVFTFGLLLTLSHSRLLENSLFSYIFQSVNYPPSMNIYYNYLKY